jgi:putative phosphoesterase
MPGVVVFSDVHGNLQGLEAVWREFSRRKPDHVFFLGDLVAFGPQPRECIELIRDEIKPSVALLGNTDRYILEKRWEVKKRGKLDKELVRSLSWTAKRLGKPGLAYLESLSKETTRTIDGLKIHLCHASPRNDEKGIVSGASADHEKAFAKLDVDVAFCGHTHIPLRTRISGKTVFNVGSVGFPFDRDVRSCYISFHVGHAAVQEVSFNRVSYARQLPLTHLSESDIPGKELFEYRLQTGKIAP